MLTNLLFVMVLSSGSAFAASRFGKCYEQTLPLCTMGTVLILFGFGLLGMLDAGVLCVYTLSAMLYMLTAVHLAKKRNLGDFLRNMVTPGSVLFAVACVVLSVWNRGKLAGTWDEFSHWMDIVKVMLQLGDFGTNPASNSAFPSYPPAMALFQYSLQKLNMLCNPGCSLSEWRVYYAYQIFFLAAMIPLVQNVSFRQPLHLILYAAILFLSPLVFFPAVYSSVYIDPMVGMLFGCGMTMTLVRRKRDGWYTAYIAMLCAVLSLLKDVGIVFSLILALSYGLDSLPCHREAGRDRLFQAAAVLAAAWIPKLLWKLEIQSSGALVAFDGKIDGGILLNVLLGKDTSFRSELVRIYWDALFHKGVFLENTDTKISYMSLLTLFLCGLYLLWYVFRKKDKEQSMRTGLVLGLSATALVVYTAGMCVIYMFKFSEYEALRLASMERYLNIAFLGVWLILLFLIAHLLCSAPGRWKMLLPVLLILLLVTPVGQLRSFYRGEYVIISLARRAAYEPLSGEVQKYCDGDDAIYFISQEDKGLDYWTFKFIARPNTLNDNYTWSIGEAFYEEDIWTAQMTLEQWQAQLLERYDYVALYKINDYFPEYFGSLFAQPDEIAVNTLYRVNKETGLLEKCR